MPGALHSVLHNPYHNLANRDSNSYFSDEKMVS